MQSDNRGFGLKQWIGCAPENFQSGRPRGFRPEAIVIHIMSGTLPATASRFRDSRTTVSAHYGVGKNGEVHQYVDERDTAFHAGIAVNPTWRLLKKSVNPNFYTIGVEHEGMPDDPWGDLLYDTSASLIAEIAGRWDIPLDEDRVVMHSQIRSSKRCPGPQVLMPQLVKMAAGKEPFPILFSAPQARTLKTANVRAKPTTEARIVRVLEPGYSFGGGMYTAAGERVSGNSFWYSEPGIQGYIWAGATDSPQPV